MEAGLGPNEGWSDNEEKSDQISPPIQLINGNHKKIHEHFLRCYTAKFFRQIQRFPKY